MIFTNQLEVLNIDPNEYLLFARESARKSGYSLGVLRSLTFSNRKNKKLKILDPNKKKYIHFGDSRYKDYIIYTLLNDANRNVYRMKYISRATGIKGEWIYNIFSPNYLSISILW